MSKSLIIYFSVYGTARIVAEEIAKQTGSDIQEIIPAEPYDSNRNNYNSLLRRAEKENRTGARPKIKNDLPISDYDTIYIGYPMWCYTFPMIIYTLFDQYDFSGKTIIPFNTHMGSRDGGTYKTIKELEPKTKVLEGLPVEMGDAENGPQETVKKWLQDIGKFAV